ncbi:MAG: PDZ domain-containing protein [Halanaerobium sp.]
MKKIRYKKIWSRLVGIIFVLFVISNFIPTSFNVIESGIALELAPIISVEDGYENEGDFLLTAVSSRRAFVWDYIYISLLEPDDKELESIAAQLPEDMDMNEYLDIMGDLMEESKLQAQTVAFRKLGYNVDVTGEGAEVIEVMKDGSAYNKLQKDDLIVEIDGKKVEMAADAVNNIRNREIGDKVEIKVLRDDEELTFVLETVELEGNKDNPSIGVLIGSKGLEYDIPGEVSFDTDNIVGPSAGSMFTMEIYNQLTSEDITSGKRIAGTGTVNLDGEVGKIDGVRYKMMAAKEAGADLFIVPAENYEEAEAAEIDIEVIKVETIDDIIEYFEKQKAA